MSNLAIERPLHPTKKIMCIGTGTEMDSLRHVLPTATFSFQSFAEAERILVELPDAVIVSASNFSDIFLAQLRALRLSLESAAIPLIVFGNDLSLEQKRVLLINGADDCVNSKANHDGFDQWIDFLRQSKKAMLQQKRVEKKVEFKIPVSKRIFDVISSFIALVLLSPIMLLIAILIKLESKGPIIYSSKRAGSGYKVFNFFKFRSMYVGADAELAKMKHMNQYGSGDEKTVFFKLHNDPRVTRIGNFLRNTSLDELPQLINVLKGDMSIVGNRPLPLYEAQMLTKDQAAMRFMAPAGITGLWQVTKRGKRDLSEEERIALDIEYANNHSLKNDINIVMKTLPALAQEVSV
jgi:lipopolysaccharide/colanic/teichoic acid biosynthesis glycosyltransferase